MASGSAMASRPVDMIGRFRDDTGTHSVLQIDGAQRLLFDPASNWLNPGAATPQTFQRRSVLHRSRANSEPVGEASAKDSALG